MIDFRYHLVSLVSVFLALAVGIVLGAGPLKEGIDVGITDQVRQLTAEKADLREQLDAADRAIAARDEWSEAVAPAVLAGSLAGRTVVLVTLPGAERADADGLLEAVEAAGATVTGQVAVQESWTSPDEAQTRSTLAAQLGPQPGLAVDAAPEEALAAVLARGIVAPDALQAAAEAPAAAEGISALVGAGLVGGDVSARATLAVVLAGAADTAPSAEETQAQSAALTTLSVRLDAAAAGAVVAGPVAASAEEGLIAAVRADDDAADAVSTVDDADLAMGRVGVALALREQAAGATGHYGVSTSADAVLPVVRAPGQAG